MSPLSEGKIVWSKSRHSKVCTFAFILAHFRVPESVEGSRIRVVVLPKYDDSGIVQEGWTRTRPQCTERCGIPIIQPAGIIVPFENVKSFSTFRRTVTGSHVKKHCNNCKKAQYIQALFPDKRCDSLKKLSTFLSLLVEDLVQTSSFITAFTSSRMGCAYSGCVAKLNSAFKNA